MSVGVCACIYSSLLIGAIVYILCRFIRQWKIPIRSRRVGTSHHNDDIREVESVCWWTVVVTYHKCCCCCWNTDVRWPVHPIQFYRIDSQMNHDGSWWWYSPSSEIETNISDEFNRCRVLSYACMDCVDEKEGMAVVLILQKHLYLTLLIEEENIFISESNEFQTQI